MNEHAQFATGPFRPNELTPALKATVSRLADIAMTSVRDSTEAAELLFAAAGEIIVSGFAPEPALRLLDGMMCGNLEVIAENLRVPLPPGPATFAERKAVVAWLDQYARVLRELDLSEDDHEAAFYASKFAREIERGDHREERR